MPVDDKASQIYSESGAKIIASDGYYVFSYVSSILRQVVSILPWVSQHKRERENIMQNIVLKETIGQSVKTENTIKQMVYMEATK